MAQGQLLSMGPGMQTQVCFSLQDIMLGSRGRWLNSETKEFKEKTSFSLKSSVHCSIRPLQQAKNTNDVDQWGKLPDPPHKYWMWMSLRQKRMRQWSVTIRLRESFAAILIPIPDFGSISLRTSVLKMRPIFHDKWRLTIKIYGVQVVWLAYVSVWTTALPVYMALNRKDMLTFPVYHTQAQSINPFQVPTQAWVTNRPDSTYFKKTL